MNRLSALLASVVFASFSVNAQYCSPTFANGCATWRVISATIGSSVNWTSSDCYSTDQTATVAEVTPTDSIPMTVTTGVWAGCAVWVDWDQSSSFDSTESVYHMYAGGDPSSTYAFNIGVPDGTVPGQYRMRIVGAWGSDGYSNGSTNGFGPCGSYQYGSFDDFTLDVTTSTSIANNEKGTAFSASPNPTTGRLTLTLGNRIDANTRFLLESMDGRTVRNWNGTGASEMDVDLSDLPAGIYLLRNTIRIIRPLRIVKQ